MNNPKSLDELMEAAADVLNDVRVDVEVVVKSIYDLIKSLGKSQRYSPAELKLLKMLIWSRIVFEAYGDCPELVLDPIVHQRREEAKATVGDTLQRVLANCPKEVIDAAEACGAKIVMYPAAADKEPVKA